MSPPRGGKYPHEVTAGSISHLRDSPARRITGKQLQPTVSLLWQVLEGAALTGDALAGLGGDEQTQRDGEDRNDEREGRDGLEIERGALADDARTPVPDSERDEQRADADEKEAAPERLRRDAGPREDPCREEPPAQKDQSGTPEGEVHDRTHEKEHERREGYAHGDPRERPHRAGGLPVAGGVLDEQLRRVLGQVAVQFRDVDGVARLVDGRRTAGTEPRACRERLAALGTRQFLAVRTGFVTSPRRRDGLLLGPIHRCCGLVLSGGRVGHASRSTLGDHETPSGPGGQETTLPGPTHGTGMRLEEYWGIGPKTRARLEEELGVERAVAAVESGDTRALVEAGIPSGRATRILRRARGGDAMDLLATRDTRDVYKELLDLAGEYALTEAAAGRIRILTPLDSREAMADRLERVESARAAWAGLEESTREAIEDAFADHDSAGGELASVRTALALSRAGVSGGVFDPVVDLNEDALEDARAALAGLGGDSDGIGEGADDRLDELRDGLAAVEDMAATPASVVEAVQSEARSADAFRETLVDHVTGETGVDDARAREAAAVEAADANDFVTAALRGLADDLRTAVDEREREVAERLEAAIEEARPTVNAAVEAVDDVALYLSLARFADAFDLSRPSFVDRETVTVASARNLALVAAGGDVQPVTYAVGDHDMDLPDATVPPAGHRVAVLTGANSGGKTTLLETLCQVQLLAQMGLPVPADRAEVGVVETVVFHRRHASFNAGVLESTLRSVVPPLTDSGHALMLVDEFEAITEPGSAADLLHGLVRLTVDRGALGVFVTHLADDLEPLPPEARTDGIFAEGLTPDLDLEVDYQPRFETVGRSTPEFIVSRLVANASDRSERSGFETLAESVGEEAVQRTLSDARWSA